MDLESRMKEKSYLTMYQGKMQDMLFTNDAIKIAQEYAEATKLALSKLQLQYLEATEQIEELKETADGRLTQNAADEISIQILSDQLADAKAENEKLSLLLNENTIKWHTAELKLQKAYQEERARIVAAITKLNEYANDKMNPVPTTQADIREDIFYSGYKLALAHLDKETSITADQPKSCSTCDVEKCAKYPLEGYQTNCEYHKVEKSCEGCEYDTPQNYECQSCDNDFSHYQARK